jgi:CcmD family protein
MLVIFAGIVAYLFSIDRKVTRLEKRIQDKK